MRILIIEDEKTLADTIGKNLQNEGYAVDIFYDGREGYETALITQTYDILILDLTLPNMDGLEICKKLREQFPSLLILILTARINPEEKISGLDIGADDYLTKPFHFGELSARIRALLRRDMQVRTPILSHREIKFDLASRTVWLNNNQLSFTKKEKSILEYLIRHKNEVVSQEELLSHVWNDDANPFTNVVRVHINSLRKKLDTESNSQKYIETIIGEGYKLAG